MTNIATRPADAIGLRDVRANLSHYLHAVKEGKMFTLTEYGKPIARLVPAADQSNYDRLVAQGVITPAARRVESIDPPVQAQGGVSDLVAEQRR